MDLILIGLIEKFPFLMSIASIVGILRLVFKPLVSIIRSVVAATASPADDKVLDQVEASPIYKGFIWFLDYFASIKLPGQK